MIRKTILAYFIFSLAVCYIITPWIFEKQFLFNEILAVTGLIILGYKRFKTGSDMISICMIFLLAWCGLHLITSVFLNDSFIYYIRNAVIAYSMFSFFIGFYLLKYVGGYVKRIRNFLRYYIGFFLFVKTPMLFERYGVSTLFPALFKNARHALIPVLLIIINIIYAFTYQSSTAMVIALFLFFLFISPGYKFFKQTFTVLFVAFLILFFYLHPNLSRIKNQFSTNNNKGIQEVMDSHPLLSVDGNTTWRLVIWDQILFDRFPKNLYGIGFGTPMLEYYPIEDPRKLKTLPYVLGGHNSYIYLFGRLGLVYLFIMLVIYTKIFKEYFYFKDVYYSNNQIFIFWGFFAITIIALFNPVLESPLFASAYWLLLGLTARCIYNRNTIEIKPAS